MSEDRLSRHSTRRQFVKGTIAASTGVVAATYVKPNLRTLGVPGALAQVSAPPTQGSSIDSSDTGTGDPTTPPSASFPFLPSTGAGGTADAFPSESPDESTSDDSIIPELLGLALTGALIGRRVVQTHLHHKPPTEDSGESTVSS